MSDTTQELCLTLTQPEVYCSKNMVYDMIRIYNAVQDLLKLQTYSNCKWRIPYRSVVIFSQTQSIAHWLQMVRNVPHLSLIPLVILWFGIEEEAKLFLTALGVFFPVYVNTFHGVRTVDSQLIEMGRSYGMSRAALFRRIVMPGALPSIFVGIRYALGIMWLTLIVSETIAAEAGIGHMAMQAREFMQTDVVVLAILIYAALGKFADSLVRVGERRALAWHPSFARAAR